MSAVSLWRRGFAGRRATLVCSKVLAEDKENVIHGIHLAGESSRPGSAAQAHDDKAVMIPAHDHALEFMKMQVAQMAAELDAKEAVIQSQLHTLEQMTAQQVQTTQGSIKRWGWSPAHARMSHVRSSLAV